MTNSFEIHSKANKIALEAGTRNPLDIAKFLGIKVYFEDNYKSLLGMYVNQFKMRAIFINDRLEEYMFRMVMAHEIGHDTLHRELATNNAMQEFVLFNVKNVTEYEANVFASHLLLDTNEILSLAHDGVDVVQMSNLMCVNVNLVLIKISEMVTLGYDLRMPTNIKKDFLKEIKV